MADRMTTVYKHQTHPRHIVAEHAVGDGKRLHLAVNRSPVRVLQGSVVHHKVTSMCVYLSRGSCRPRAGGGMRTEFPDVQPVKVTFVTLSDPLAMIDRQAPYTPPATPLPAKMMFEMLSDVMLLTYKSWPLAGAVIVGREVAEAVIVKVPAALLKVSCGPVSAMLAVTLMVVTAALFNAAWRSACVATCTLGWEAARRTQTLSRASSRGHSPAGGRIFVVRPPGRGVCWCRRCRGRGGPHSFQPPLAQLPALCPCVRSPPPPDNGHENNQNRLERGGGARAPRTGAPGAHPPASAAGPRRCHAPPRAPRRAPDVFLLHAASLPHGPLLAQAGITPHRTAPLRPGASRAPAVVASALTAASAAPPSLLPHPQPPAPPSCGLLCASSRLAAAPGRLRGGHQDLLSRSDAQKKGEDPAADLPGADRGPRDSRQLPVLRDARRPTPNHHPPIIISSSPSRVPGTPPRGARTPGTRRKTHTRGSAQQRRL